MNGPYARADLAACIEQGYSPIPVEGKFPPVTGYTGWAGKWVDLSTAEAFRRSHGAWNVALRLPDDAVGVDVDAYDGKGGLDLLGDLERELGPLPSTVMSTARDDESGIRLFRKPEGWHLHDKFGGGIEVVQRSHRYVMCAPSIHPKIGRPYRWIDSTWGGDVDLAYVGDLPDMPWSWLERFKAIKQPGVDAATSEQVAAFLAAHIEETFVDALKGPLTKLDQRRQSGESRHDSLLEVACWAMREAAAGWYTAEDAIAALFKWWNGVMADDIDRRDGSEFASAISWAIGQTLSDPERIEEIRMSRGLLTGDTRASVGTGTTVPPKDEEVVHHPAVSPDLDDILDTDEPDHDWLVEDLFERGDRTIFTAFEGTGKSTLLRQIGVQLASGVHPFTLEHVEPVRVLLVDVENPKRKVRRELRGLRVAAGDRLKRGMARFQLRPEGLDLTHAPDRDWLRHQIEVDEPEILIIGPIYKLATGDPKDEQTARTVALYLDGLRAEFGIALIIEAHVPYGEGGKSSRPQRPYGASLWSRWPEFGLFLAKDGTLSHWRGARDERPWPAKLERGDEWPWMVAEDAEAPAEWDGPRHAMNAVVAVLEAIHPTELTRKALLTEMKAAGHPFRHQTIDEATARLVAEKRIAVRTGARKARLYSSIEDVERLSA